MITELRDRAIPWAFLLLSRNCGKNELNIALPERIRALVACLCAVSLVTGLVGLTPVWLIAFFPRHSFCSQFGALCPFLAAGMKSYLQSAEYFSINFITYTARQLIAAVGS